MDRIYMKRPTERVAKERPAVRSAGPDIAALAAGAQPTREQMGSRVDLPGEIREKMENSFGADFSNVKLYESDTVAQAGAEAVTQGNSIAFAPGKLDLASTAGQALLGHELSHVVSQSRGESAGRGFLNDAHLEAQADRQGMMAARGESVYQGPVSPVGASSAVGAAGPMQASKKSDRADKALNKPDLNVAFNPDLPMYREPAQDGTSALTNAMQTYSQKGGTWGGKEISAGGMERVLRNRNYYKYLDYAMENTKDEDKQQKLLKLFMGGDEDAINSHLRKEAKAATKSLKKNSSAMNSEIFRTRANAYSESDAVKARFDAINSVDLDNVLSEKELAAMKDAEVNFDEDQNMANKSMRAHASFGYDFIRDALRNPKQMAKRRAYRRSRRSGKSARDI